MLTERLTITHFQQRGHFCLNAKLVIAYSLHSRFLGKTLITVRGRRYFQYSWLLTARMIDHSASVAWVRPKAAPGARGVSV